MNVIQSKKRLFALMLTLVTIVGTFIMPHTAYAAGTYSGGGWAQAGSNVTVYKYSNLTVPKGTIYANEGFTILESETYDIVHVQYSAPGNPKDGYISLSAANASIRTSRTCVAKVKSNAPVYYCNNTTDFKQSGTVYTNELVAVIGKVGNWSFIEYNTDSGKRKRGYVSNSKLTYYSEPAEYLQFFNSNNYTTKTVSGKVYTGPSNQYVQVDTISNKSVRVYKNTYNNYAEGTFVSYTSGGKRVAGYLIN